MASVIHFDIATEAEKNPDFRRVLWTGTQTQLVIMTIPPDGEIGEEVHEDIDQILTFVSGTGEARISGNTKKVTQGDLVVVPAGTKHNFVNTGPNPLILYTVYGPPEHADGAVHRTKEEATRPRSRARTSRRPSDPEGIRGRKAHGSIPPSPPVRPAAVGRPLITGPVNR